jgi:molybdopterin synthase sulfur carrier subunit
MFDIKVQFFSYFRDVIGYPKLVVEMPEGSTIAQLSDRISDRFPEWATLRKCALAAVDVDYQTQDYLLKPGDEVSFFPPVQGG